MTGKTERTLKRNIIDPLVSARALARVITKRNARGEEPLTFGMTFPFSTHNYHLRFWMAAGGVDPDEDVRLVVLPPPYMVESLANGQVDGFCVGAPWNSVAVDLGIGFILHFVCEILPRAAEKVLAVRSRWAECGPVSTPATIPAPERRPPSTPAPVPWMTATSPTDPAPVRSTDISTKSGAGKPLGSGVVLDE